MLMGIVCMVVIVNSFVEAEVLKMKILIRRVFMYLLCSMVAQCVLCSLWRTHTGAEEKCERKQAAEGKPHTDHNLPTHPEC